MSRADWALSLRNSQTHERNKRNRKHRYRTHVVYRIDIGKHAVIFALGRVDRRGLVEAALREIHNRSSRHGRGIHHT